MASIAWTSVETITLHGDVVHWPWLMAVQSLRDVTHLLITAEGEWEASGGQLRPFPPDGHMGLPIQADKLLVPDCPPGALVGKIGGSSAHLAATLAAGAAVPGAIFPVGAHCIVSIPSGVVGPLFIGFNWIPRPLTVIDLKVCVFGAAPV